MKRKVLALTIILGLLLSTLTVTLLVHVVTANPFMPSGSWSDEPVPPSINVESPSKTLNYCYGSDVWLNFTVTAPSTTWYSARMNPYPDHYAITYGTVTQVRFSLDRNAEKNVDKISEYQGFLSFSVKLGSLSVGRHIIRIYAEGLACYGNLTHDVYVGSEYSFQDSTKTKLVGTSTDVSFVVTDTPTADIPLEQPIEEGELTTLTVEPFPTTLVVASVITVAVVGMGLIVYLKKCKRASGDET